MLVRIVFLLMLSFSGTQSRSRARLTSKCKWISRTSPTDLSTVLRQLWWSCVFDNIKKSYNDKFSAHETAMGNGLTIRSLQSTIPGWNPLKLPPPSGSGDVTILKAEIRQIDPKINSGKVGMEGYFHLTWKDERLAFDRTTFKMDHIKLADKRLISQIWVPLFEVDSTSGKGTSQASELIFPTIKSDGTVTASVFVHFISNCDYKTKNYPYDKASCKAIFVDKWSEDAATLLLKVDNPDVKKSDHFMRTANWDLQSGSMNAKGGYEQKSLEMTVILSRMSNSADVLLLVPIILATILAALAPLFGTFRWQALIKVVALFLMYIALGNFVQSEWTTQLSSDTPRLLLFYKFTMIVTMGSLMITLILWGLARKSPSTPPPHRLTLCTETVTKIFYCTHVSDEKLTDPATDTTGRDQWHSLYSVLNCLCFFVFLILYVIGIIVYCA